MYGVDSGNGYVYGDDPAVEQAGQPDSACADTCPEQAIEPTMDKEQ